MPEGAHEETGDMEEDVRPFFWSPPFLTDVRFENNVAQARDVLAGERNFLSSIKTAVYVMLAATSITGVGSLQTPGNWKDWALSGLLLALGGLIPLFSLLNYAHAFDSWQRELAAVHTTQAFTACVLLTAVVAILIIVREFTSS